MKLILHAVIAITLKKQIECPLCFLNMLDFSSELGEGWEEKFDMETCWKKKINHRVLSLLES